MVDTKKFSEFISGGDVNPDSVTVGVEGGLNTQYTNPTPFLSPGNSASRPAPDISMYNRLRFNTDLVQYEFYDPTSASWMQLETSMGGLYLPLSGGTMSGDINMDSNEINNLPLPTTASEPATKGYVDGIAFNTHPACNFGTTANLTGYTYDNGTAGVGATLTAGSNGAFSTDGQSPALNDRILVKDQASPAQNGIYVLSQVGDGSNPAILTRSDDYNQSADMQAGDEVAVVGGDTLAGSKWMMVTTGVITVGTTSIVWFDMTVPNNVVTIDGAQTITGDKTFSGSTALGTPASGTLTNCDGLPIDAGTTGTLPVDRGGSGRTSAVAYSVLCGGTTGAGMHQSVAGVGTAGQVLKSAGAGSLPSWEDESGGGGLQSVQIFTASGTWNKPVGVTKIIVQCVGAGGGGAVGGVGFSNDNLGGGGSSGGYGRLLLDVSAISSETVTIGIGGAGSGSGNGSAGGTSSFGAHLSCTGGGGGIATTSGSISQGGVSSGGDSNISGTNGATGGREFVNVNVSRSAGQMTPTGYSGYGATSKLGPGGRRGLYGGAGSAGLGYGSGGGGGWRSSGTGRLGGDGADGAVLVYEYE